METEIPGTTGSTRFFTCLLVTKQRAWKVQSLLVSLTQLLPRVTPLSQSRPEGLGSKGRTTRGCQWRSRASSPESAVQLLPLSPARTRRPRLPPLRSLCFLKDASPDSPGASPAPTASLQCSVWSELHHSWCVSCLSALLKSKFCVGRDYSRL